jgi:hypothetical protein
LGLLSLISFENQFDYKIEVMRLRSKVKEIAFNFFPTEGYKWGFNFPLPVNGFG